MAELKPKTAAELEINDLPTALTNWILQLQNAQSLLNQAVAAGPKVNPSESSYSSLMDTVRRLRAEMDATTRRLNGLKEVLTLRKTEADLHAAVVNSWPPATAAREVLLLGSGLFGAGGAAYAVVGYPRISPQLVPPVLLWVLGLGLILWGLNRLVDHDAKRWAYFERTLDVPRG